MNVNVSPFPTISLNQSRESIRILAALNELHAAYKTLDEGSVANYIPELARVNPDQFAIAVMTVKGEVFVVGDAEALFTVQSAISPFIYGIALAELGQERVLRDVGVEPTGNPFHAIVLERGTNRPMNPLVNAGAIAIASMLPGRDPTDRLNRMLGHIGLFIGSKPEVDMQVFISEKTTADRNRSIAYLMRNFGHLERDLEETLDLYFQACSILVTPVQLANMAATLANGGVNPVTGQEAISRHNLRNVLTLMFTCGLYERSGLWAYNVGVPAKSGVSGGFLAVVPGEMGIAVFSPRLDQAGNSIRGLRVCQGLVEQLGLHIFGSTENA